MDHNNQFRLPNLLVGASDILRLKRELDALYDYLHQAVLRHTPADQVKMPKTSRTLDELARLNNIDLLQRSQYEQLLATLEEVYHKAPRMHIAFATDPSAAFTGRIVDWLRANISPVVLVQIGLQPTLGAGCIVRTTNEQFDFSIREHMRKMRPKLIEQLDRELVA